MSWHTDTRALTNEIKLFIFPDKTLPSFLVAAAWSTMLLRDSSVSIMVDMVGTLSLSNMGDMTLMLVMVRGSEVLMISCSTVLLISLCCCCWCCWWGRLWVTESTSTIPLEEWQWPGMEVTRWVRMNTPEPSQHIQLSSPLCCAGCWEYCTHQSWKLNMIFFLWK